MVLPDRCTMEPSPSPAEHFLVPLYKNQICAFIELPAAQPPPNPSSWVTEYSCCSQVKSLHFGGFQEIIEFRRTASRTSGMLPRTPAACMKSSTPSALKHGSDLFETRIHQAHVFRQFLHEQIERLVSGIQFHRRFDIPFHGMRLAVVAYRSEGLIRDRTVGSCD